MSTRKFALLLGLTAFCAQAKDGGGADTGGANTVNGFVLEKFLKKTDAVEGAEDSFKTLKLLAKDIPALAENLEARAAELSWYILPIKLDELPREITDIGVATDQTAIQRRKEVFVDENKWKNLTGPQKTDLVTHEIVLRYYLRIKENKDTHYPALADALVMADMRKISSLVEGYQTERMDELTRELYNRGFGAYLSRGWEERILGSLKKDFKDYLDVMCADEKARKLSMMSIIYYEKYAQFQTCSAFPRSCDPTHLKTFAWQQSAQKSLMINFTILPAWVELKKLYPDEMTKAKPDMQKLGVEQAFADVYPDKAGTPWDFEQGEAVCKRLAEFKFDRLQMEWKFWRDP